MCPLCPFTTRARYDTRPVPSSWQHLDFGTATVVVFAHLRRIDCPEHGVLVEAGTTEAVSMDMGAAPPSHEA